MPLFKLLLVPFVAMFGFVGGIILGMVCWFCAGCCFASILLIPIGIGLVVIGALLPFVGLVYVPFQFLFTM